MIKTTSWDSAENEAKNSFVSWSKIGDYVYGTLIAKKTVKSTLPGKENDDQTIYEVLVKEGRYHVLDDHKKVVEAPITLSAGDIVSVGGRSFTEGRMNHVKIGQMFGQKFTEEIPAKTKGFNPTKVIKVFTPKNEDGTFMMDSEFIATLSVDRDF